MKSNFLGMVNKSVSELSKAPYDDKKTESALSAASKATIEYLETMVKGDEHAADIEKKSGEVELEKVLEDENRREEKINKKSETALEK